MSESSRTARTVLGLLLAGAGVLLLLINLGFMRVDLSRLWPFFPLGVGLTFLAVGLLGGGTLETRWALIPGSIVTTVGLILFLISFDLVDMGVAWPVFPFGVGVSFLLMYALGIREGNWPLYPGFILTTTGTAFFITTLLGWQWWPLLLVGAGVFTLLRRD